MTDEQPPHPDIRKASLLAILCLCAGLSSLSARWISNDVLKLSYGLLIAAVYLAFTVLARKVSSLRRFWELSFAFFILALVQLLNNSVPSFVGIHILHDPPVPGNPLASTVSGTVIIQLLGTLVTIVPIIALTKISGNELSSIYARIGKRSIWIIAPIISFIIFAIVTVTHHSERLLPTNGTVTLHRLLVLTPALLVLVISNGFQEEFLFRGLFLQRYNAFFGVRVSNVLQAIIFAIAHAGITYTPASVLFIVLGVFPLGLFGGYLMRRTNGVVTPALFHAGADIPIYLAFLSYVA